MTIRRTRVDTQTQRELLSPERQSVAAGALATRIHIRECSSRWMVVIKFIIRLVTRDIVTGGKLLTRRIAPTFRWRWETA